MENDLLADESASLHSRRKTFRRAGPWCPATASMAMLEARTWRTRGVFTTGFRFRRRARNGGSTRIIQLTTCFWFVSTSATVQRVLSRRCYLKRNRTQRSGIRRNMAAPAPPCTGGGPQPTGNKQVTRGSIIRQAKANRNNVFSLRRNAHVVQDSGSVNVKGVDRYPRVSEVLGDHLALLGHPKVPVHGPSGLSHDCLCKRDA